MTWVLEPFDPSHLDGFEPQEAQADADLEWIECGQSLRSGGRTLAIFGGTVLGPSVVRAWAILSRDIPMIWATRAAQKLLSEAPFRRVEITADVDFQQANKWAEMLGFQREGVMSQAGPNGEDFALYARIQCPQHS